MRLIWAYSPFDPRLTDDGETVSNMQWHGTRTRGAVSTYIEDDAFVTKFPDEDDPHVKRWDMLMTDVKNGFQLYSQFQLSQSGKM